MPFEPIDKCSSTFIEKSESATLDANDITTLNALRDWLMDSYDGQLGPFFDNEDKISSEQAYPSFLKLLKCVGMESSNDLPSTVITDTSQVVSVLPGLQRVVGTMKIIEIDMIDIVGEYETPDGIPEWEWVERNSSMSHRENGTSGVWDFLFNMATEWTDAPPRLQQLFTAAAAHGFSYLLFHQGT